MCMEWTKCIKPKKIFICKLYLDYLTVDDVFYIIESVSYLFTFYLIDSYDESYKSPVTLPFVFPQYANIAFTLVIFIVLS